MYGDRLNQLDLRIGKIISTAGRAGPQPGLYNVLNGNPAIPESQNKQR